MEERDRMKEYYAALRAEAEMKAAENTARARENQTFRKNDNRLSDIERELAFAEIAGEKGKLRALAREKETLRAENEKILASMGLTIDQLSPVYRCPKCKDTGFIGTAPCACYLEAAEKAGGSIGIPPETLPAFGEEFAKEKGIAAAYQKTLSFAEKFPDVKIRNINFLGRTGTGKTLLAGNVAARVAKRGFKVIFLSSFEMNNVFLEYHSFFEEGRTLPMNALIAADLLVIDDLGAEQNIRNVTVPYLCNLLSERGMRGRSTLITSNLSQEELLSRYAERVFSRIFDKRLSTTLSLGGGDGRLKR